MRRYATCLDAYTIIETIWLLHLRLERDFYVLFVELHYPFELLSVRPTSFFSINVNSVRFQVESLPAGL